jgi:hypothetical protein
MLLVQPFSRSRGFRLAAAIILFSLTGPLPVTDPLPVLWRFWTLFLAPLWDLRNIRPFSSSPFILALVYTAWRINEDLSASRSPRALCLLHGGLIGLILQGDLHTGIIASIATAVIGLWLIIRAPRDIRTILVCALIVGLSCAVVATPMAIQAAHAHPDALRRFGQIPIARMSPPFRPSFNPIASIVLMMVIWLFIVVGKIGGEAGAPARRALSIAVLFSLSAVVAQPLSVVVLGKGIQIYHFGLRANGYIMLSLVLSAFLIARSLPFIVMTSRVAIVSAIALGSIHLVYIGQRASAAAATQYQQRPFKDGWPPISGYRQDFIALWRELSRPSYDNLTVLGTFDHQLAVLWASREGHLLYLPDPFLSTVPDAAIERRLIAFSQLVGMTDVAFAAHLREEYFSFTLLNTMKWHASRLYTFSDITQYSPEDQRRIRTLDWGMVAPADELSRLQRLYTRSVPIDGRLDLIIVNRRSGLGDLPGPSAGYRQTYSNDSFAVWVRSPSDDGG